MTQRTFWLDLFTGATWQQFLDAGAEVSGFRENRWRTVQRIRPGDYLLCYLTGVSRFIGVLDVLSEPYRDDSPIWPDEDFPCRLRVRPVIALTPETAVPVQQLRDALTVFQDLKTPNAWTGRFRGSPSRWKESDGRAVLEALREAKRNPVSRPVDPRKLARRPRSFRTKVGPVTIPESEQEERAVSVAPTAHDELQWLLLKLGNDMGLSVWVARNDRGKEVRGNRFRDLPRLRDSLPAQFDEATNRTIELIDVLWLQGNSIVAAFEIECTTSIYSGLLRMSDLIAMQPNLNIPLYLVAPDERRDKVVSEVNRPTFSSLPVALNQVCRYVPVSELRERYDRVKDIVPYLRPEFLEEISEACVPDEA